MREHEHCECCGRPARKLHDRPGVDVRERGGTWRPQRVCAVCLPMAARQHALFGASVVVARVAQSAERKVAQSAERKSEKLRVDGSTPSPSAAGKPYIAPAFECLGGIATTPVSLFPTFGTRGGARR